MWRYPMLALLIVASVSAVVLARRRVDHRPFAAFLVVVALADLVRDRLSVAFGLLRPLGGPPFVGAQRIAFHLDEALFLTWPTGIAMASIALFVPERRRLVIVPAVAWAVLVGYLATHYPEVRGESLRLVYLFAELAALIVSAASIIAWTWRREPPTPARICMLQVGLIDLMVLLGGAMKFGFWTRWDLNQAAYLLLYGTLTGYQVITWRSASGSR